MHIKFWGTRGSSATSLTSTASGQIVRYLEKLPIFRRLTVGGNPTWVAVRSGDQLLIIDAGSGRRLLGFDLMQREFARLRGQAEAYLSRRCGTSPNRDVLVAYDGLSFEI